MHFPWAEGGAWDSAASSPFKLEKRTKHFKKFKWISGNKAHEKPKETPHLQTGTNKSCVLGPKLSELHYRVLVLVLGLPLHH